MDMGLPVDAGTRVQIDVGQIIAGKYELVKLLGKGAMGEVWLATHNTLGGEFAIKLVEPEDDIEAETAAGRFQLEAQIAAKLSRKTRHVVSVSDHGEEDGLAYLVMERLEGESLEARVQRGGPIPLPELAAILSQVARALAVAHDEGIFHRDLKPANVWLGRDEDQRLLVKLLDFGIARSKKPFRTRSPFATSKDMVLGTPSYMSPEQARGLDSLDYRCDLWALAVGAYEALTRTIPFEGTTVEDVFLSICTFRVVPVRSRRPDLSPAFDAFFARAFAERIEERFQSATELSEAFDRLLVTDLALPMGAPLGAAGVATTWRMGSPDGTFTTRGGSSPDLQSAAGVAINIGPPSTRMGSQPDMARPGSYPDVPRSGSYPDLPPSGSYPDLYRPGSQSDIVPIPHGHDGRPYAHSSADLQNVALHGPRPSQRPGSKAWLLALAALFALLSVGIFAFVLYREGTPDASARSFEAPPNATALPPASPPPVSTVVEAPPPVHVPEPTSAPVATLRQKSAPVAKKVAAVAPPAVAPTPAPQPVVQPVAPVVAPTAAPAPAPAPKAPNKSEIL